MQVLQRKKETDVDGQRLQLLERLGSTLGVDSMIAMLISRAMPSMTLHVPIGVETEGCLQANERSHVDGEIDKIVVYFEVRAMQNVGGAQHGGEFCGEFPERAKSVIFA